MVEPRAPNSIPPDSTVPNLSVQQALDDIVQEFNRKIAELSSLTAELPRRLLVHEEQRSDALEKIPEKLQSNNDHGDQVPAPGHHQHLKPWCKRPHTLAPEHLSHAVHHAVHAVSHSGTIAHLDGFGKFWYHELCPCFGRIFHWEHMGENECLALFFKLDFWVSAIIIASCILSIVEGQFQGYLNRLALGYEDIVDHEDGRKWAHAEKSFFYAEHVINFFFLLELGGRFYHDPKMLCHDNFNILDLVLIISSSIELYILEPLGTRDELPIFRMFRLVKILRSFRLLRILRLSTSLRILVRTIISSFGALITSMILLALIMIIGGFILNDTLFAFIQDPENNIDDRTWVYVQYGSAMRAIFTLLECTLSGGWPVYFRPLMEKVHVGYAFFIVPYVVFVVFAIIRIISALFLKDTLQVANSDAETLINDRLKQTEAYCKKLEKVFKSLDTNGSGKLGNDEFRELVGNSRVRTWMQVLDLEVRDAQALFRLLDDGNGEITYEEFVQGILRLKGQARSMDIVAIMRMTEKNVEALRDLQVQVRLLQQQCSFIPVRQTVVM